VRKQSQKLKISSTVFTAAVLFLSPLQAHAQFSMDDSGGGTIDIQAAEQEFADDHMIARGNVHVTYKDSIIDAPMATLYKDANGKPQRAVFTGHPRLRQGPNLIHADKLTFDMTSSLIIADGNAHSEVIPQDGSNATKASKKIDAKATGKKPAKESSTEAKEELKAEGESEEIAPVVSEEAPKPIQVKKKEQPAKQEKIITDADHQQYNRNTGQFDARGNVRVRTGDVFVKSDALKLVYDAEQKPETALFTGHVKATQGSNCTEADLMTYFLTTKRLQATGHVKSTVVQTQQAEAPKKGGPFSTFKTGVQKPVIGAAPIKTPVQANPSDNTESRADSTDSIAANPQETDTQLADGSDETQKQPIFIFSDSQDYSENTGRCTADGNVKLLYGDTIGVAPKMVMVKNVVTGETEKVLLYGRCQITQPGKRWIADRITYTVADNKVIAEGNTKAFILQQKAPGMSGGMLAQKQAPITSKSPMFVVPKSTIANTQPKPSSGTTKLSASKVETPK